MEAMKTTLLAYSRQLLQWSQAAAHVSQEWGGLYSHSSSRAQSLHTFGAGQSRVSRASLSLYKDSYGWDVLKVFDDWEGDAARVTADIDKTAKAREQVAALDEKVRSLRAAKERRVKRGEVLDKKEEAQLEGSEAMLDKYNVLLSNMRLNLDKNLAQFFEARYAVLDKAFVRFMEIQGEFFREGAAASATYQGIIDNYRRRFPRPARTASGAEENQFGPTPDPSSPLPTVNGQNGDASDMLNLSGSPAAAQAAAAPARSRSTPPQQLDSHAHAHPHAHPHAHRRPSPPAAAPAPVEDSGSDASDSDSGSDSDDERTDSSDEDEPAPRRPIGAAGSGAPAPRPTEPVIDLFNFPADAAPAQTKPASAAPAHRANKPSAAAEDDLSDFFGSGAAKPAASSNSSAQHSGQGSNHHHHGHRNHHASPDFEFDFSGGGGSAAQSAKLPQSVSTPALSAKKNDLLSFDPFAMSSPPAKSGGGGSSGGAAAAAAAPAKARSTSPAPAAPGTSTSGMVNAYIPPTHRLDEHIAEQQELKVAQLKAAEEAAESALEARRSAEGDLEATLSAWEFNKDGNKKNIRNLLSSVHTVLWPNSGWKPISFADLIDFTAIKKAHMKVIRVVHPDRLTDATPEQMVIALRVFDVLNTAFDQFKETGN